MIRPSVLTLAISRIYGSIILRPLVPQRWLPCPECAPTGGRRLSACPVCKGATRLEAWPR